MFTLNFSGGTWTGTEGNEMQPQEVHNWFFVCQQNQGMSITAFPIRVGSQLSVAIFIEGADQDPPWNLHFTITNTGTIPIPAYTWAWLLADNHGGDAVIQVG